MFKQKVKYNEWTAHVMWRQGVWHWHLTEEPKGIIYILNGAFVQIYLITKQRGHMIPSDNTCDKI